MLDAENDYFSTPMARPYGYVAPRLVAHLSKPPREFGNCSPRPLHNPAAKPKHFARWQHRAAPACPPAGAFTIWVYWIYGYCSNFAVTSPPNICARPGRRCPHFMVKWCFAEILGRVVGAARFELTTPCTQNRCATRLRHAPTLRLL